MIRVIYIMGYGRSGSTVLNALLGQQKEICSVGELINLPRDGWLSNHYCSCGRRAQDCDFWEAVRAYWRAHSPINEVSRYVLLQSKYASLMSALRGRFGLFKSAEANDYVHATQVLYEAIASISGAQTIVDSSKSPGWVSALVQMKNVQLTVIHLIRDGRGAIVSLAKTYSKSEASGIQHDIPGHSALRTSVAWCRTNLMSEVTGPLNGLAVLRIRYEDLMSEPLKVISKIAAFGNVNMDSVLETVSTSREFSSGCSIAGNRNRMNKHLRLTEDTRWKSQLRWRDAATFWSVCAPVALRYGYRPFA